MTLDVTQTTIDISSKKDEKWIPDGPWSDVMSFLLMNKHDFDLKVKEIKEIDYYKGMSPTSLHFDNPEICDRVYSICRKLKNWNITHKCCGNKGFMISTKTRSRNFIPGSVEVINTDLL